VAYRISVFLVRSGPELLEAARARWPECRVREVTFPFQGMAVASPLLNDEAEDAAYEEAADVADALYGDLLTWSRSYPEALFVFVDVEYTLAGCECEGYVCRNGEVLAKTRGDGARRRLLAFLGVRLDPDERFPPLEPAFYHTPEGVHHGDPETRRRPE